MNIYIACSLTHLPRNIFEEYTEFIHSLYSSLGKDHVVQYALADSDPQLAIKQEEHKSRLCYLWDRKMVEWSELVIAECSFPSTGMGIELQIAENNDIPIVACFKDFGINRASPVCYKNPDNSKHTLQIGKGYISHMVLGLPNLFKVIQYYDRYDGITKIYDAVQMLNKRE